MLRPLAHEWQHVSLRTGEMIKHALNSFLAVNICFANELGNICDAVGADGKRVGEVLRLEPRVGARAMLLPGLGFAGGTLARDMQTLRSLGRRFELDTALLDGAWKSNAEQNRLVIRKLTRRLGEFARCPRRRAAGRDLQGGYQHLATVLGDGNHRGTEQGRCNCERPRPYGRQN